MKRWLLALIDEEVSACRDAIGYLEKKVERLEAESEHLRVENRLLRAKLVVRQ